MEPLKKEKSAKLGNFDQKNNNNAAEPYSAQIYNPALSNSKGMNSVDDSLNQRVSDPSLLN